MTHSSADWERVYHHEISRRRRLWETKPAIFKKIHSFNPKGLIKEEECKEHVWIPASHLAIHDNAGKQIIIDGMKHRGFKEAMPFRDTDVTVVPQMCFHCEASREYEIRILTTEQRLAEQAQARPRKKRGKKQHIENCFSTLFGVV